MQIRRLTALAISYVLLTPMAFSDEAGEKLYASYCAACHGTSGMGDGDMADVINIPSPNLTLLSLHNDGEFPMLRVIHTIDGRTGLRAHGSVMPMFGRTFTQIAGDIGYGAVLETRGQILSLAMYLESIQAK
jgi:mono/diheme cytochrome c family protein